MNLDDLRLFIRVAQTHSLTTAARQIDRTPAAVSAAVKRIEREVGARLIERTTRSMRLTAEGERFLQTCESTLMAWTRGHAGLQRSARSLEGLVRVAAPQDTGAQFLVPWLAEFAQEHAAVQVSVITADRIQNMAGEDVDIAIRYGELEDSTLVGRVLARSERVLVAAPSYLKRFTAPKAPLDLMEHRCLAWLRRDQPKTHWSFFSPAGATETVVVKPVLCGDGALVRAWAVAGNGIAYKAMIDVAEDLRSRRLVRLLSDYAGEPVPISAVTSSARYLPARVKSVLEFLTQRFQGLQAR
jgi:DNA-binding transcriptional LysR family regulator